jgi:hypothetical protein
MKIMKTVLLGLAGSSVACSAGDPTPPAEQDVRVTVEQPGVTPEATDCDTVYSQLYQTGDCHYSSGSSGYSLRCNGNCGDGTSYFFFYDDGSCASVYASWDSCGS